MAIMVFNGNYGFQWQFWVFIGDSVFSLVIKVLEIMHFQWQLCELLVFVDNYVFSMAIMGFHWQSSVFNGGYGFSVAMIGLY